MPKNYHENFPNTEHVHFYGFYLGNYPSLHSEDIDRLCNIIFRVILTELLTLAGKCYKMDK